MNVTSFRSGRKAFRLATCPVIESAPIVLPWNEPKVETIFLRPLNLESLSAASFASAPELQKKTFASVEPVKSFNFSANSIARG